VPLGSDVCCASGKNIGCDYRKESSRALRLLRPRVVVLVAWPQLVLLPGSVACASSAAAAAPSESLRSCAGRGASVGGAGGVCICFVGKSDLVVSQNTLGGMHFSCGMLSTTIVQIPLTGLRARDADGGSYRRRVAGFLPWSTSLALG
jgi:hypothetical protein